jgi:hypothetical protein
MSRNVAEARRSQLVSTFGVGSLFPAGDQSFMITGLDYWNQWKSSEVPEPRLARSLGVRTFRMPPSGDDKGMDVPVIRFPRMHYCPECGRLDLIDNFGAWNEHECKSCQRYLVPSRFVACCTNGHIEDFPYHRWVHAGSDDPGHRHRLKLSTRGQSSSLADIVISCSCGVPSRSMAGSFGSGALAEVASCQGRRPWLLAHHEGSCEERLRTLQRGSSNVWFATTRSAISIPPWSEGAFKAIDQVWPALRVVPVEALEATLTGMGLPQQAGLPAAELVQMILTMRGESDEETPTEKDLREEEYRALVLGRTESDPQQQFVCDPLDGLRDDALNALDGVSRVARLREVRAVAGFTRVMPAADGDSKRVAPLSYEVLDWLPAVEVLGEGVFVRLREDAVVAWSSTDFAQERAEAITAAFEERARIFGHPAPQPTSPRLLLLHSFAHILLTELSLDAGYPVASLRERVYGAEGQAGVLVYTATADSAGSLGGLSAQSRPDRIWDVIQSAVRRARWCSSDPVCIESVGSGTDALNLAACHACLLLPETSCERMNQVLDRASLIGRPNAPETGFFHDLIS